MIRLIERGCRRLVARWPLKIGLALAFVMLLPHQALAASACTATVETINFGNWDPVTTSDTDVMSTITVTCTELKVGVIDLICPSINIGTGGWNGTQRTMIGPGGATLRYGIFQDAARSIPWGSLQTPALGTVPPIFVVGTAANTGTTTATIFARLPGNQPGAPAGHYISTFSGNEAPFGYEETSKITTCVGFVPKLFTNPTFDVTTAPQADCTLNVADLTFPTSTLLNAPVDGTTTLDVTCAAQAVYSISLDNGLTGTSPTDRKMTSAASDTVTYGLYRDSAHSQPWGTDANGQSQSGTGTGSAQTYSIFGEVPAQPGAKPGTYTDRVIVTVTY